MQISLAKPILLNFDSLFEELELPIIMKLDQGISDPQSIANCVSAYSKSQNGSEEYFRALEPHIIKN